MRLLVCVCWGLGLYWTDRHGCARLKRTTPRRVCERTVIEGSNGEQQGYGERTGGTGETDKTATDGFLGETGARRQAVESGRSSRQ